MVDNKQTVDMAMSIAEIPVKQLIERYISGGLIQLTQELSEKLREMNTFDAQGKFTVSDASGKNRWNLQLGIVEKGEIPNLSEVVKINMPTATQLVNLLVHSATIMLRIFNKYSNHPVLSEAEVSLDAVFTNVYLTQFEIFPVRIGIISTKIVDEPIHNDKEAATVIDNC
jgi:hypothetical protein